MLASVPPASMISASPLWMIRKASPMALAPVEQAMQGADIGPFGAANRKTDKGKVQPGQADIVDFDFSLGGLVRLLQESVQQNNAPSGKREVENTDMPQIILYPEFPDLALDLPGVRLLEKNSICGQQI